MIAEMQLPPEYRVEFSGQSKMLGETAYYFLVALGLSILFMYLILAAQFESWMNPMAILSALPVTIPFGLMSLLMFRHADGPVCHVRAVHAGGHRQEERHLASRQDQRAAARGGMPRDEAIMEANHTGCGRS